MDAPSVGTEVEVGLTELETEGMELTSSTELVMELEVVLEESTGVTTLR